MNLKMPRSIAIGVGFIISGLLGTGSALAEMVLEEVIVSAQKRDQNLNDVPIAISSLSDEALKMSGSSTLTDIVGLIPSVGYTEGSLLSAFSVRGIQTITSSPGLDDSVSVYVDGFFLGRQTAYNPELFSVERVEVLRGPQGTLFGKNTIAGAVSIITKRPSEEFEAEVQASYGLDDLHEKKLGAYLSGSLVEGKVAANLSVSSLQRDGYLRNNFLGVDHNDQDRWGVRTQLLFTPNERLEILVAGDYLKQDTQAVINQLGSGVGAVNPFFDPSAETGKFQTHFAASTPRHNDRDFPDKDEREIWGIGVTVNYEFDSDFTFTSLTGYRKVDTFWASDLDATTLDVSGTLKSTMSDYLTQEFRLTSPKYDFFDYVIGVYYFHSDIEEKGDFPIGPDFELPFVDLDLGRADLIQTFGSAKTESHAAYFHGNYHLTDSWTLTGGLRYTYEERDSVWNQDGILFIGLPNFFGVKNHIRDDDWSPTVSLSYRFNDDTTAYLKYTEGFKSGGFNMDIIGDFSDITFEPESAKTYELGFKAELFDRRARLNAAIYKTDYQDLQVYSLREVTGEIRNAGEATIKGAELELSVVLTENLLASFSTGYIDTEFDEFDDCGTVDVSFIPPVTESVDCEGNKLAGSPQKTASAAFDYRLPMGAGDFIVYAEWRYTGDTYFGVTNRDTEFVDAYSLYNARLGYSTEQWSVYLWGKNLTDEKYELTNSELPLLKQDVILWGLPRTFGLEFNYSF